ncbi:hypothetical protein FGB62_187g13 [Gracilaria domingensis]|nr:hypothetical protein FGB62_187g13 [Gracilaria domingensis]
MPRRARRRPRAGARLPRARLIRARPLRFTVAQRRMHRRISVRLSSLRLRLRAQPNHCRRQPVPGQRGSRHAARAVAKLVRQLPHGRQSARQSRQRAAAGGRLSLHGRRASESGV